MSIEIVRVQSVSDCAHCHRIASQVWGPAASTPVPQLLVNARYGGIVLLAVENGDAVGFLFSFPARFKGEWVLWSHETAVLPSHANRGIGSALKRWQRQAARSDGYQHIVWTFDPLVSRNAYFNLQKLKADIVDYHINVYGTDESDYINKGLETDRFVASWATVPDDETQRFPAIQDKSVVWLRVGINGEPIFVTDEIVFVKGRVIATEILASLWEPDTSRDTKVRWRAAFRHAARGLLEGGYYPATYAIHNKVGIYYWRSQP